ncbi:MAG: acetoacetyl-coenzyme A synthetase [marine bacterium B5-7]|nr:MAG: acetoacetyl-coenzyme A synthetase [marine bacterium B5-7]
MTAQQVPLWSPSPERVEGALISEFCRQISKRTGQSIEGYPALHRWSVENSADFWDTVWEFCGVIASNRGEQVIVDADKLPGARFYPDARLNFAENLLRYRDDGVAMMFRDEHGRVSNLTRNELYERVAALSSALRDAGLAPGDRVAAFMPNIPETVIAMLACVAAGGVFSSCSPDFGVGGVLDRFGQIEPRFLFAVDAYYYNGKTHDSLAKLRDIAAALPSLKAVVVTTFVDGDADISTIERAVTLESFVAGHQQAELEFEQLPFNHPLYIMYSSGTTGVPKCIVHGAGGTLLKHLVEHQLHCNVLPATRLFYFTTCGWMMWNWLVSGLASGATLMLYDGSPFYPNGNVLFDYAQDQKIEIFGTSAKYIDACAKAEIQPAVTHRLDALKSILSTGSPLSPEAFDYIYASVKTDVCLSSIAGGTDIISCFVCGCPALPVYRGEIQVSALALDVQALGEDGEILEAGEKGELCCMNSFPAMPIGFWNDDDGGRYRAAYFERFPGIWCHGDYVARTEHDGWIIYGRSDAVLNPGGVRIGTAEIYRQAEKVDAVLESLVIGQQWDNDVRVVLFVRLKDGHVLDDALIAEIRDKIRRNATPRHVPSKIIQVADIPRTKSGKIVELAVRKIVHGEEVKNREALANPEALDLFVNLPDLK